MTDMARNRHGDSSLGLDIGDQDKSGKELIVKPNSNKDEGGN